MNILEEVNLIKISEMSTIEAELVSLKDSFKNISSDLESERTENNNNKTSIDLLNKKLLENKVLYEEIISSTNLFETDMTSKILKIKLSHDTILEELRINNTFAIEVKNKEIDSIKVKFENTFNIITNLENNIIQKEEEITIMISENASLIKKLSVDDDKYYDEHMDQLKLIELKNKDKIETLKISYDEEIKSVKNDLFNMEEGLIYIIFYYLFINLIKRFKNSKY